MEATTPRAAHFRANHRQRFRPGADAECPEAIRRAIQTFAQQLIVLGCAGMWTDAERQFRKLRETALRHQRKTLDPFDVALSDTTFSAEIVNELAKLNVSNVGQLGNVPRAEFDLVRIGPARYRNICRVARTYGVQMRD